MRIRTDEIFDAFRAPLELIEDEAQRARLQRVIDASRDSVERAVHEIVREAADEMNEAGGGAVRVELVYGAEGLELTANASGEEGRASDHVDLEFDASDIERLTLRLPAELKEIAADAAERAGISLNAWLTRLVSQEAGRTRRRERGRHRRDGGQSLKGWIGG